jgi:hypothetical protein
MVVFSGLRNLKLCHALPDHSIKNIFAICNNDALGRKNHACKKQVARGRGAVVEAP